MMGYDSLQIVTLVGLFSIIGMLFYFGMVAATHDSDKDSKSK